MTGEIFRPTDAQQFPAKALLMSIMQAQPHIDPSDVISVALQSTVLAFRDVGGHQQQVVLGFAKALGTILALMSTLDPSDVLESFVEVTASFHADSTAALEQAGLVAPAGRAN